MKLEKKDATLVQNLLQILLLIKSVLLNLNVLSERNEIISLSAGVTPACIPSLSRICCYIGLLVKLFDVFIPRCGMETQQCLTFGCFFHVLCTYSG